MIINTKITINRPREEAWDYFHHSENLKDWIEGLKAYHHVSGEPGEIGSTGVYEYRQSGETIELRNELIHAKAPEEFTIRFNHKDFDMVINFTLFEENGGATTSVICNTAYDFRSFFWQVFSKLIKNKLEVRQREDLKRLKAYVEMAPVHEGK